MKIICSKSEFLNSVNIALKAIPSKSTMTILECMVIKADDDSIKLISNDMELGIETKLNGQVIDKGEIAVNAKIFSEIIRKLPDGDITVITNQNLTVEIICEKSKFSIQGRLSDEFPFLAEIEKNNPIILSSFTLKEVIRQTVFSISDNESNKIMTGELFEINTDELKVVSLDGHRVSIRKIQLKDNYENVKLIVNGKILNEISKILTGEMSDDVYIYYTDKYILLEFNHTIVLSRLIEGEYYRISHMITDNYDTKVDINKKEFLNCIDRATLLLRENDKKPIIIGINDNIMDLKMNTSIGTMNEEITVKKEGKDILIGFNPKFLIDALRVIDDDEVTLYMTNSKAPCFIRDKDTNYIYMILPVNFNAVTA